MEAIKKTEKNSWENNYMMVTKGDKRVKVRAEKCVICGGLFPKIRRTLTCSPECKEEHQRRWRQEYYKKKTGDRISFCDVCGEELDRHAKYCKNCKKEKRLAYLREYYLTTLKTRRATNKSQS